jgi:hypothetical protein
MRKPAFVKRSIRIKIRNFMDLHSRTGEKARRARQIEAGQITESNGLEIS